MPEWSQKKRKELSENRTLENRDWDLGPEDTLQKYIIWDLRSGEGTRAKSLQLSWSNATIFLLY